ncbi:MAG: hypothetical protein ACK5WZ_14225 [Pseudobdellovibrionaceae bacterium]
MKTHFLFYFLFHFFGMIEIADAFPEMVRHNYINCSSCHVSPHGGGLMTEYGRHLSKELLSTWGKEGETNLLYGAIPTEKVKNWLNLGGGFRGIQVHQEDKNLRAGRWITMQLGVEVGLTWDQFTAVALVGKPESNEKFREDSQRYYLLYQPTEVFSMRAGKFLPTFGLNIPHHTIVTRSALGLGQGQEREVVEANWIGPKMGFSVSAARQVKNLVLQDPELGYSAQFNVNVSDSYRLGSSLWSSSNLTTDRRIFGVHGILGFTEKFYSLLEFDWMDRKETGQVPVRGFYHFGKLGYEVYQGVHLLFMEDYSQADVQNSKTLQDSKGIGFAFYPRPHFEFEGIWFKKKINQSSDQTFDYAWFLAHYYF